MNCIFCGQHLRDGAVFCSACGKKQPNSAQGDTPSSSGQPTPVISPDGNRVASFCYSCKATLPAGATVCPQCGAKINRTKKEIKKPRRKLKKVIGGIIVALVCLILAGTLLLTAAGVGIAAFLLNRPAEPVKRSEDLHFYQEFSQIALYGNGKGIKFNNHNYFGYVTPNEKYIVYVDQSSKTDLFIYNTATKSNKTVFSSSGVFILQLNDAGVFFYNNNDIYSYNFKSGKVTRICSKDAEYIFSNPTYEEEMSIAYFEDSCIFTHEVKSGNTVRMNADIYSMSSSSICDVSADGSMVSFVKENSLWYADANSSFALCSIDVSDNDYYLDRFYCRFYPTKNKGEIVINTVQEKLFIIKNGSVISELQVPCVSEIFQNGISADFNENFDADKPFYISTYSSETKHFSVCRIYGSTETVEVLFDDANQIQFFGDSSILYISNGVVYLYNYQNDENTALDVSNVNKIFASPYGDDIAYMNVRRSDGGFDLYRYTEKDGAEKIANHVSEVVMSYCGNYVFYVSLSTNTLYVHNGREATVLVKNIAYNYSGVLDLSIESKIYSAFVDPENVWIFTNNNQDIYFYNGKKLNEVKISDYIS